MECNVTELLAAYDKMIVEVAYERIARELAARNPDVFVQIVNSVTATKETNFPTVDVLLCQKDMLIPAIKEHRGLTGAGLRESKEYCEKRRDELRRMGKLREQV
jgi:ribosomal protein L7/L12